MTDHEKRVEQLVDLLECSIFEAEQIIADDKKIDKGERVDFDLSVEEEKQAKKWANVREHKKPTVYVHTQRERKTDTTKVSIIDVIFQAVSHFPKAKIVKPEKTIMFMDNNNDIYTIDLGKATKKTYDRKLKELNS